MTVANDKGYTADEINQIKRFMLDNNFRITTTEVLDIYAKLIYRASIAENIVMNKEYAELAATIETSDDNQRVKLAYYAKKNFEKVRDSIKSTHGYYIGEYFSGVKNFVEQMAIAYSLYANF